MIEFQITDLQYIKMMRAIVRRRLLIIAPAIYGALWIVGWILFAIAEGDAWSDIGSFAVLLLVSIPFAALFTSIFLLRATTASAEKKFQTLSKDGRNLNIECQLGDGQLEYRNVSQDNLVLIDLKTVKRVIKFKNFFLLEISKRIGYIISLNTETEILYFKICEQRAALKNS